MNLDYLRSFYEIVESNSISKAAEKLHLTQPGLSMQLKNLEKDIGAKLLIRSNKGVRLTKEGTVVYDQAKTMLSVENKIRESIKDIETEQNILSISACKSIGENLLPSILYDFKSQNEDLDISLKVEDTCHIIKDLMSHEINIAIITEEHNYDDITSTPILEDHMILVASYDSDIDDEISIDQLKELPLILRDDASCTRLLLLDFLEPVDLKLNDLNILLSINSPESIKSMIVSGSGLSFLPGLTVKKDIESKNLKEVKIRGLDTRFNYHLAHRDYSQLTKPEKKFKDFIKSEKEHFSY